MIKKFAGEVILEAFSRLSDEDWEAFKLSVEQKRAGLGSAEEKPAPQEIPDSITTKKELEDWLIVNGYDGLLSPEDDCACVIGNLLICGGSGWDCKPGFDAARKD